MAYEVTKRIGEHWYRYRVEGYRDPQTRRVRQRWTYLGRIVGDALVDAGRRRSRGTRERIVAAILQMLEKRDISFITVDVIARAARVSRATFYRYFPDKNAALSAAINSVGNEMLTSVPPLDHPISTLEEEHERLARWVRAIIAACLQRPGVLRAYGKSPHLEKMRSRRREISLTEAHSSLLRYIGRLRSAGFIETNAPELLATGIMVFAHGIFKRLIDDRQEHLSETLAASGIETICRAVFGTSEPHRAVPRT